MVKKGVPVCKVKNGLTGSRGSSFKGILFFLFALAVCFGYFYFFTDVLRTKEETPGQPDVFTSEVKKPLPERLVQSSATSGEEAVSPPPVPLSPPATSLSEKVVTDSRVSPGDVPAVKKTVKALPAAGKPPVAPLPTTKKKIAAVEKSVKTVKAPVIKKMESAKTASSPTTISKRTASPTHTVAQKTTTAKAEPGTGRISTAREQEKKGGEQYTLVVGTYVLKSSMRSDKVKLEKSGLQTAVMPAKMRNEPMNRLLVAEIDSYPAAQEELSKVKKASKDAFLLRENNKYAIYAGSYFADDRASQEQERLRKLGFAPILKKSQAPVSTYSLTVGSYPTRDAALKGAERLKKLGFKPYPVALTK